MKVTYFFSLIPALMLADDAANMREAKAYYDTNQNEQGRVIYEDMLQEHRPAWQQGILMYNVAKTFSNERQWQQALTTFNAISSDGIDVLPLLDYMVKSQIVWTYWQEGLHLALENPTLAKNAFKNALENLPQVEKAYCALEKARGNPQCQSNHINSLRKMIQTVLDGIQQENNSKIKLLLKAISYAQKNLTAFSYIEQSQRSMLIEDLKRTDSFWRDLELEFQSDSQQTKVLSSARDSFQQALLLWQQGQLSSSSSAFENAAKGLEELLKTAPPPTAAETNIAPQILKETQAEKDIQQLLEMEKFDMQPIEKQTTMQKVEKPW